MKNPICISTGCVYKIFGNRYNERIEALRKFSPVGLELSFFYPKYLLDFEISKDNLEYLQTLKFNSIHAPVLDIVYGDNKKCKETLKKITELYKQINARNVVFHKDLIKDYSVITGYDFVASIENDDWNNPKNTIEDTRNVLDNNREFKLTFDFAHAIVTSSDISEYINYFKDRIAEIHISVIPSKELGIHAFLYKHDSREIRRLMKFLKAVSVPLVLECEVPNANEIELIEKEMQLLKKT